MALRSVAAQVCRASPSALEEERRMCTYSPFPRRLIAVPMERRARAGGYASGCECALLCSPY